MVAPVRPLFRGRARTVTGDVTQEPAAATPRGPLTERLLVICRRRTTRAAGVEVTGDRAYFDEWLELVTLG